MMVFLFMIDDLLGFHRIMGGAAYGRSVGGTGGASRALLERELGAGVTQPIIAEIRSRRRIVRFETLRTVGVVIQCLRAAVGYRTTDDRACCKSTHSRTPTVVPAVAVPPSVVTPTMVPAVATPSDVDDVSGIPGQSSAGNQGCGGGRSGKWRRCANNDGCSAQDALKLHPESPCFSRRRTNTPRSAWLQTGSVHRRTDELKLRDSWKQ